MQKIKLALKVFHTKSGVEKILVRLANETLPDVSQDKHINPLVQIFRSAALDDERDNAFEAYNSYLKNSKGWLPILKLLYISHELVDQVGEKFCTAFLSEHFENIFSLMKNKDDVEGYVHGVLASNYYNFLISFARYSPDIHLHRSRDSGFLLKSIQEGDYTSLVQLLTFKNVLKYFTKVEECIEGSANLLKERGLINKISLSLFKDVIVIYNLVSKNLKQTMPKIFEMDSTPALLLDEIYSDFIQISKKLKQLIDKAGLENAFELPKVDYYTFDADFNRQEELYILELKKDKQKTVKKDKQEPYQIYMQQYQNFVPGKNNSKLNTKSSQHTKTTEPNGPKSQEYFNLASPEASNYEDDSVAPINKAKEDYSNHQGILVIGENGDFTQQQTIKGKMRKSDSQYMDLEDPGYHMGDKKKDLKLNCDFSYKGGSESVVFTPTSTQARSLVADENTGKDLASEFMKTDLQHQFLFDDPSVQNQKNINGRPANL